MGENYSFDAARLMVAVRRCLRSRGVSAHELNDLVHEVMIVLLGRHARISHFEHEGMLRYARVVARGVAAKRWRRDGRRREIHGELASDKEQALRQWIDPTYQVELRRNLVALSLQTPASVEALLLTEMAGLTNEEVAHQQGVPVGTVKTRLRSLRKRMRAALEGKID